MSSRFESANPRREEAERFLFGRIDYERALAVPYRAREFKLDRMRELLRRLGDPQAGLPIVHVAGTKGKGSVTAVIGSVLTEAGYRTGAFTSPHLERVEERIAVDGRPCSAEELAELVARVRPAVEAMDREALGLPDPFDLQPTYFEITTAMALWHFAHRGVDAAVLEVGLGGRLDSTNICQPAVSVITSISLDHTRQLGPTLASIAGEKAGIIKPGVPVVSGVVQEEPREVIRRVCQSLGAPLWELDREFAFDYHPARRLESAEGWATFDYRDASGTSYRGLRLGMLGLHQAANAAVSLAALSLLARAGWRIGEEAIREGLARAACPARIEVLGRRPVVVIDAAHNRASAAALVAVLRESFSVRRRWLVFGTTQEKDLGGMLDELLGAFDEVVFTRYSGNPRSVDPTELARLAAERTGRPYPVVAPAPAAWSEVLGRAGAEDLICVSGSFFLAAEIRQLLLAHSEVAQETPR